MKKELFFSLCMAIFGNLVYAQTNTSTIPTAPTKPVLQQPLNPNTDHRNQQMPKASEPAPTPAPASRSTKPISDNGKATGPQSRTATTQPPKVQPTPTPTVSTTPASVPQNPVAAAKQKLADQGYEYFDTNEQLGPIYHHPVTDEYRFIDSDGVCMKITKEKAVPRPKGKPTQVKAYAKTEKTSTRTGVPIMVAVNRWISYIYGDWESIPESHVQDAILLNSGFKNKTFQYNAYLTRPSGAESTAVYRWTNPNCNMSILLAEHELTDAQLLSWGYKDKTFQFYAYKTRPTEGNFLAVSRWVNALPVGHNCRDFTLSVTEREFTDAQLISWGYTSKMLQFYVPAP